MNLTVNVPTKIFLQTEDMKKVTLQYMQQQFKVDADHWIEKGHVMFEAGDYHSSYKEKLREASIDDVLSLASVHALSRGKSILECLPAEYRDALLALDNK